MPILAYSFQEKKKVEMVPSSIRVHKYSTANGSVRYRLEGKSRRGDKLSLFVTEKVAKKY